MSDTDPHPRIRFGYPESDLETDDIVGTPLTASQTIASDERAVVGEILDATRMDDGFECEAVIRDPETVIESKRITVAPITRTIDVAVTVGDVDDPTTR